MTGPHDPQGAGRPQKEIIPPDLESPEGQLRDQELRQMLQALDPEALVQNMIGQLGPQLQEMVRGQLEQLVPLLVEQSLGDQVGQQLEKVATEQIPKIAGLEITKAMQTIVGALPNLINQGIETQFKQILAGQGGANPANPATPATPAGGGGGHQPGQQVGLGQLVQGAAGQGTPLEQMILAGAAKFISGQGQPQQSGVPDLANFMQFAGYLNQLSTQSSQQQLAGMQLLGTALKYSLGLGVSPEKAVEAMDETIRSIAANIKTPPVPVPGAGQ